MNQQAVHRFWRSSGFPFVESRCANDSVACYAPHSHAALSLGAVDGGQSVFRRGRQQQTLGRGDVVLIPAGEVHCCNPVADSQWSYQMLYLDERWLRRVVAEIGVSQVPALDRLPQGVSAQLVHMRLTRLNACLFGAAAFEDKEAALLLFAGDLFGSAGPGTNQTKQKQDLKPLRRAQAMIKERYTESLPLDVLATEAGMSRYHFIRAFARELGMTPHAWQLDLRIQKAKNLLDQGMALADAALQLGFADQSHFQRVFKQRVAVTPGEYRRNFLQD